MAIHSLTIDGIEVQIEGNGPRTVVMIHGWPDTHRLWDGTVGALQDRYRCVRFTLPGFDASLQPRPTSLAAMVTLFRSIVDAVSPAHPVTLSSPAFRCASGCSPCPRGCGTSCNATGQCSIWCCASSKRVIAQSLQAHCIGAANADKESLHIGAVAFIHRFGSSLNEHVHFHVCVVDGVFEEVAGEGSADAAMQISASGVVFHPATGIDATPVAQVQTTLQKRILRAFVGRGLLENFEAKEMLGYKHSGFSVDAGVCIEAHDRAALERLLRYCAIARVHRFPWSAYAKREANWCTAAASSAANPPVTSAVPRLMSCTSHRWS